MKSAAIRPVGAPPRPMAVLLPALLVLAALVPLLLPEVPPLSDLPAHMARLMLQQDGGRTAALARWYGFHWNLLPNLGTDLIGAILEPRLGLQATMKAIAMLIVALQCAGYLLLSRVAHGRIQPTALFALPLAYANPFQYGFLNFTFAAALATLALALWLNPALASRPRLRWLVFVPIAAVLWISHLAGWGLLCLMVGCCELAARRQRGASLPAAFSGGFVASSCLLLPQVLALLVLEPTGHLATSGFFRIEEKLYFLANVLADRWESFDRLSALVLIAVIAIAWVSRAFVLHRGLALSALALLALYWILPGWLLGSYYADMRLTPSMFALALIAARPADHIRPRRLLVAAGLLFIAVRLAGNTASMAMWDRQIRQELRVLDRLPRETQLVSFSALPCRTFALQGRERDLHLASYALIRRHAFANDQFAMPGGQLLSIHNPAVGPFDRDPSTIEFGESCQGTISVLDSAAKVPPAVPYLWILWRTPERPVPGWTVRARSGGSVLYARRHAYGVSGT